MNLHLSSEQISKWTIGERTPEAERHVRECSLCRTEVERLENAFAQFRDSGWRWSDHWYSSAPQTDAKSARPGAGPISRLWGQLSWAGILAASVLISVLLIHRPIPVSPPAEAPPPPSDPPFVEIPYVAPLAPYERTEVMRIDVPVAALMAAGFEVHVPDAGGVVRADVLVGQDGRAHAIRLVPSAIPNPNRRLNP